MRTVRDSTQCWWPPTAPIKHGTNADPVNTAIFAGVKTFISLTSGNKCTHAAYKNVPAENSTHNATPTGLPAADTVHLIARYATIATTGDDAENNSKSCMHRGCQQMHGSAAFMFPAGPYTARCECTATGTPATLLHLVVQTASSWCRVAAWSMYGRVQPQTTWAALQNTTWQCTACIPALEPCAPAKLPASGSLVTEGTISTQRPQAPCAAPSPCRSQAPSAASLTCAPRRPPAHLLRCESGWRP